MKITKETLIQLIKEELAELQEQRIDREAEADADVRQSIARGLGRAGKSLAGKVANLDPRTAQKKRAAGYKGMADKEFDDPREQVRIAAKYGAEHGADRTITEPDPPQAFAVDKEDIVYRAYINAFNRARAKNENRVPNADMLEKIIFEEFEAALSESDAMKDKAARAVWELYSQDKAARPDVRHPDGEAKEKRLTAKRQKKRLATGKARDDG